MGSTNFKTDSYRYKPVMTDSVTLLGQIACTLSPMFRDQCVRLYVCLLVTTVSCAKSAEPIEMPFGLWTQVGPRNHVLSGAWIPQERGNLGPAMRPFIKILWPLVDFMDGNQRVMTVLATR